MVRGFGSEEIRPLILGDKVGEHGNDEGDGEHSRCEQEELFEPDPFAMFFMGLQQEVHGSPFNALLPHQVDQVDQQRNEDQ